MQLDLAGLIQVGVNNIIIAKANGREMSIYELRVIDQFAKTTYASLRLNELLIQQEIDEHDEDGTLTGDDSSEDIDTTGDGDHTPVI